MAGGQAITSGQGDVTATQILTGSEIASATGFVSSPASDVTDAATGSEATFAQTSPSSADMSVRLRSRKVGGGAAAFALTGQAATVSQESITRVVSVLLGGSGMSASQGGFTKQRSRLLSGSQIQGQQGFVTGPSANENTPPQWETVSTVTFYQGTASNQSVASFVDDYDNDVITFAKTAGSLPSGVTFNTSLQRYEYNGTGGIAGTNGHVLEADDGSAELPPYRVSDLPTSGPNSSNFNDRLDLAWVNAAGDWMDSAQQSQGSSPYATLGINGGATGLKTWTVTTLVQRWMTNPNRGFYLRATGTAFTFDFSGRLNATTANRPKLTVVTNVSTFDCPCLASAWWSPSSGSVFGGTDFIRVNSASRQSIVQFDLSAVTGTVSSATLQLFCSLAEQTGNVVIFEANPPTPQVGGDNREATLGIAAAYTYDIGIDAHPDVLFATDFPNVDAWEASVSTPHLEYATFPADGRTQSNYIKSKVPAGDLNGSKLLWYAMRGTTNGSVPTTVEDELYFRYYCMYENGWGSDVDSNKMPGFDMRMGRWETTGGGTWNFTHGNGGDFGDGKKYNSGSGGFTYQGMSARGHSGKKAFDGHVYDDIFCLRSYIYQSFFTSFSDPLTHAWNGFCISKNRWFCIEHYCRMNTLTGSADGLGNRTAVADGIYRTWVDGVLAWEKTDFQWRCHPEIGVQGIWMENYHGGTTPPDVDLPFRWNHVVVSRSYIGPRRPV